MSQKIRCHYEVLDVAQNADEKTIKKAHRKLALKYHPDKTGGCEESAKEFRLVQQAYECLSDPSERKWYDEHRESILRGGKGFNDGDGNDGQGSSFIFDVTPFHFSGCFNGYGDDENGFFHVYRQVFENILRGEKDGWISEGNIDETQMPNSHLPSDFGCGSTDWKTVSHFYNSWESFSSCLSFAFSDKYDPRDADSRWVRRRMEEENKKARKVAKRERNEEVIHFVLFVKKCDPRVKAALKRAAEEKKRKEEIRKEEERRKKMEAAAAREAWKMEREQELKDAENADLDAGRIRLADLSDSDDDNYGRGRKKGKRGKKNKRRAKQVESSSEEEVEAINNNTDENETSNNENENEVGDGEAIEPNTFIEEANEDDEGNDQVNTNHIAKESLIDDIINDMISDYEDEEDDAESSSEYESSSEEEPEPEIFRCDICNKTFKSKQQLDNHLKSKKHKEAVKKLQKKKGK